MTSLSKDESENYAEAGAVAEEVLSSVRTVVAFGGQEKEVGKYAALLKSAQKNAFIRGGLTATTMGLFFGFIYGMYGLGLWYGVKLMLDDRETEEFINCTISCNQKFTVTDEIVECVNSCFRFRASFECEDFTIIEKAPTRAFSWLKALSHLRHYQDSMLNRC